MITGNIVTGLLPDNDFTVNEEIFILMFQFSILSVAIRNASYFMKQFWILVTIIWQTIVIYRIINRNYSCYTSSWVEILDSVKNIQKSSLFWSVLVRWEINEKVWENKREKEDTPWRPYNSYNDDYGEKDGNKFSLFHGSRERLWCGNEG